MAATNLPAATPTTDAALFDALHAMFGIGDYDENADLPWWKYRSVEITKIKRSRAARDVSLAELYLAALYAKAHGHDIRAATWLYRHITPARGWWAAQVLAASTADFDRQYAAAISEALGSDEHDWVDRLVRVHHDMRTEVLTAWRASRRAGTASTC